MRERLANTRNAVPEDIEVEPTLISGDPVEALMGAADAPGTALVVGSRAMHESPRHEPAVAVDTAP
jgi:hypothetical protein